MILDLPEIAIYINDTDLKYTSTHLEKYQRLPLLRVEHEVMKFCSASFFLYVTFFC